MILDILRIGLKSIFAKRVKDYVKLLTERELKALSFKFFSVLKKCTIFYNFVCVMLNIAKTKGGMV